MCKFFILHFSFMSENACASEGHFCPKWCTMQSWVREKSRWQLMQCAIFSTWSIWDTTSERRECRVESSLPRSMYPSKPAVLEIVSGFEISSRKRCMLVHSCSRNWFMKDMYSSLLPNLMASRDRKGKKAQRVTQKCHFRKCHNSLIKS